MLGGETEPCRTAALPRKQGRVCVRGDVRERKRAAEGVFGRKLEGHGREAWYLCSVSSRSFMYLVVFSLRWLSGERERERQPIMILLAWYPSNTHNILVLLMLILFSNLRLHKDPHRPLQGDPAHFRA